MRDASPHFSVHVMVMDVVVTMVTVRSLGALGITPVINIYIIKN